jgi:hypothetical protein
MDLEKNHAKKLKIYSCETCAFTSSNKNDYRRHELTRKHLENVTSNEIESKKLKKTQPHICENCEKIYKSGSGLWNHKKKCSQKQQKKENTNNGMPVLDNTIVYELLRQNQEFKEIILEQNKKILEMASEVKTTNNNNKTITTNSHNNTNFNLQFFLNETCKDAITADQFVKDIQISFGDLENIGNQGYVQGFTDIILKQLRTLDVTKRPFHCTDVKRETIYIKDSEAWKKDSEEKTKLKNVIEKVAHKGRSNVNSWQQTHPEVAVLDSQEYDMNHKILRNTWGDGETDKLQEKVIKNIAKEVHVDK